MFRLLKRHTVPAQSRAMVRNDPPPRVGAVEQPCVARQPILDRQGHVFAYELFFRRSQTAQSCDISSTDASARVIVDALLAIGLDSLTGGKRAFINTTRDMLVSGAATLLPPNKVVIELLEDIEADAEVRDACAALKRAGYSLALDDFGGTNAVADLLPLVDFVKVDFLALATPELRAPVLRAVRAGSARLVAEKIETPAQSRQAATEGFAYFQGYFYGRPAVRAVKQIAASRLAYGVLLVKLVNPNIHVAELERLIKQDVSLSYRVLRAVNSGATPFQVEIKSIRHAIVLLGTDVIRRWASLWAMAAMNESAHPELAISAIIRAHCCERLEASARADSGSGFLLGMCSRLDAILEQPMEVVLQQLPVDGEIRAALLGEDTPSRALLDCVIAYERGEWDRHEQAARRAGINAGLLPDAYREALRSARELDLAPR